jgi:hypothetical protein
MTMTTIHGHRSPEDIAELFDVVGREPEAIRQLTGWVEELHEVQAAKQALSELTPAEVRAALEYRRTMAGDAP